MAEDPYVYPTGPWFVGAMNDGLFIIDEPPRPAPVDFINPNAGQNTRVIAKLPENDRRADKEAAVLAAGPELVGALREAYAAIARLSQAVSEFAPSHPALEYAREAGLRAKDALAKAKTRNASRTSQS